MRQEGDVFGCLMPDNDYKAEQEFETKSLAYNINALQKR